MPIAEYKHLINSYGRIEVPGWVKDRGYHYRDSDKTYLGWVEDSSTREYLIPDDVLHLDKAGCVTRQLAIHAATPFTNDSVGSDGVTPGPAMTTAEVTTDIENWYDNILSNNGE